MRCGGKGKLQGGLSAYLISPRSLRETLRCWRAQVEALRTGSYADCLQAMHGLPTLLGLLERGFRAGQQAPVRAAFRACRRQLTAFNASGDARPLLEAAEHLAATLSHQLDRPEQTTMVAPGKEPRTPPRRAPLPQAEARTRS